MKKYVDKRQLYTCPKCDSVLWDIEEMNNGVFKLCKNCGYRWDVEV